MAQGSGGVTDEPRIECKMKEAAAAVDGVPCARSPGTACRGAFRRYMPPAPDGVPSQRLNNSRNVTKKSVRFTPYLYALDNILD
ncbi:hypothetical protein QJS10_CPA10g01271 [Acorus calamus]|uniref:Uncharacterized protein n=1 Tax=Acorus calamus TaxID=4465 RepID=A0AAV9DY92_ACOCL|nr:hypothetical protein QJS10_CPA10g01271 [Acorus calamus]